MKNETIKADAELLELALAELQATGKIEYFGEFGAEITTFVPFVGWLKQQGHLTGRKVISFRGMRPYYYFLDEDEFEEKAGTRLRHPPEKRIWPSNTSHDAVCQPWHVMPDYRTRYQGQGRSFDKPVLFIQNKFTVEWQRGPINFLPLNGLRALLSLTGHKFDVVYSRPRPLRDDAGYTEDHNSFCHYPDIQLVREFPDVLILEDHCEETGAPYNLTKLEILAKSRVFVGVQGGGTHLLACFDKSILLLWHVLGSEFPHAYQKGPYKYLSNNTQTLLLARDIEALQDGVRLVGGLQVRDDKILVPESMTSTVKALRI